MIGIIRSFERDVKLIGLVILCGLVWLFVHSNEGVMTPLPPQPQPQYNYAPVRSLQPDGTLPDPGAPTSFNAPAPPSFNR